MDTNDWKVTLVEGRNSLIEALVGLNWSWTGKESKIREINEQIKRIDVLLGLPQDVNAVFRAEGEKLNIKSFEISKPKGNGKDYYGI